MGRAGTGWSARPFCAVSRSRTGIRDCHGTTLNVASRGGRQLAHVVDDDRKLRRIAQRVERVRVATEVDVHLQVPPVVAHAAQDRQRVGEADHLRVDQVEAHAADSALVMQIMWRMT